MENFSQETLDVENISSGDVEPEVGEVMANQLRYNPINVEIQVQQPDTR